MVNPGLARREQNPAVPCVAGGMFENQEQNGDNSRSVYTRTFHVFPHRLRKRVKSI